MISFKLTLMKFQVQVFSLPLGSEASPFLSFLTGNLAGRIDVVRALPQPAVPNRSTRCLCLALRGHSVCWRKVL